MPPITPIDGFGAKRWKGYESLGTVYQQYVPPAMQPGVVAEMAKVIPQPQSVFPRGAGPFAGLGIVRYSPIGPFHEPPVVRRMAQDLDTPMMAGATASQLYFQRALRGDDLGAEEEKKITLKDAMLTIGIASVALIVTVSGAYWFAREMARPA